MLIISFSFRDSENIRWKNSKTKTKQTEEKKNKWGEGGGEEAIVKGWELNDFFKSNLELALSIILKQRIIWIKLCCGGM